MTASVRTGPEAVGEIDQIDQTQHPPVEPWQGDVQGLGPPGRYRIQSVIRPRESPGHRGDRVCVTAEVDRPGAK
ncbi:hypothetical protein GCM10014715_47770 [Streptomyces spiralis]|uniref:Uncharacterized protein n=1 Tax=Streptomyces spiralis TaxID=66376 RepID=A0A919A3I4_9ACTN|nr:hypothetical protein GCM10014715_47770 [Streptomyces spiralis]